MQLSKKDLDKALEILSLNADVFVPGEDDNVKKFVIWEKEMPLDLEGQNTQLPPKDILFPKTEKMYSYKMGKDAQVEEIVEKPNQVIFGIRPCDVRSIECMDKVFYEKTYVDSFYARKRENLTIIAMACESVQDTCFCDSMGLSPVQAPGADVLMTNAGENLYIDAQTEKGQKVLEAIKDILSEENTERITPNVECTLKTNMTKELPAKLLSMFEDPIWDDANKACIGCGTCTYVCPTCYCFDIDSENYGDEGTEFRCWDSCMFSEYTRMAGGHNPRPSKKERVRNRYLHKLSYFNDRYGMSLCVGCGRCVDKCPAHMDITDFINRVSEVE